MFLTLYFWRKKQTCRGHLKKFTCICSFKTKGDEVEETYHSALR